MLNYNPARIPPAIRARLAQPANSDAAYGSRLSADLLNLIADPMTFTPDYTTYYPAWTHIRRRLLRARRRAATRTLAWTSRAATWSFRSWRCPTLWSFRTPTKSI
jgi:hypothetical protein